MRRSYPRSATVGHLVVPRQWNDPAALDLSHPWAMDNGAFGGFDRGRPVQAFDEGAYLRMLQAYHGQSRETCRFVTAPDVVGDAAATLGLWPFWSRLLRGLGWRPAFVAQDGLTPERMPNLRHGLGALFIGGSTAFKESLEVRDVCAYAAARGIWVHWGRVNSRRRYEMAVHAQVDSIDGTGFSMYPDTNIPKVTQWQQDIAQQPGLEL